MHPIKSIRKNVFGINQAEFASLMGVSQPTLSRWENGEEDFISRLMRIRSEASVRGIEWKDTWFFEPPAEPLRLADCAAGSARTPEPTVAEGC